MAAPKKNVRNAEKPRMFKVVINPQEGFEGKDDVKLGVNGNVFQVKRGYEVVIPESYLGVLKDAKYTIISKDDQGNEDIRDVPRFSFSIMGEVIEPDPEDMKDAANDA